MNVYIDFNHSIKISIRLINTNQTFMADGSASKKTKVNKADFPKKLQEDFGGLVLTLPLQR